MIEILIVIGILTVLMVPLGLLFESEYRHFVRFSQKADLTAEAATAAQAIFAQGPDFQIDHDNHGLTFQNGTRARFEQSTLKLGQRTLTRSKVLDFTAVRRGDGLTLNIVLECPPAQAGQPPLPVASVFSR